MDDAAQRTILHYRVERKLGEGGMGAVYLALDTKLDRKVALKFLVPGKTAAEDARERLLREARAASRLSDSNILTIFAVEQSDEGAFIAMEYVEGATLREFAEGKDLSIKQVLDLAVPVAEGLAAAHDQGVIHRDVKPDNVLVGAGGRVKVMDFGLSKIEDATRITQEGAAVGTLAYMSPEQARAQDLDARTDVFSFGVLLYELLAQRSPFSEKLSTPAAAIQAILNHSPEPLARYKAGVPDSLQAIVSKALEKDREYRYAGMRDVLADLRRVRREIDSGSVIVSGIASAAPSASSPAAPPAEAPPARREAPVSVEVKARSPWPYVVAVIVIALASMPFLFPQGETPPGPAGDDAEVADVVPTPTERGELATSRSTPLGPPAARTARQRHVTILGGSASEPTVSPDATQIAFVMDDGAGVAQVWIKSLSEGDPLQLTRGEKGAASPAWSPTGRLIAFVRDEGPFPSMPMLHQWSVWVVAPPTGKPRRLAELGEQPSWTPDGKELIYESFMRGVTAHDVESGKTRALDVVPRNPMPFAHARPTYSPDGKLIAYFKPELGPAGDIWVVAADGGEPRRLTHDVTVCGGFVWSPDSASIVLSSSRAGSTTLWSVPVDGSALAPVTAGTGEDSEPAYGADGRQLVYTNARHTYRLRVLDPATGKARTLYENRNGVSFAEFAPDGSQIAFCTSEANGYHVFTIGSDGKGLVRRTSGDGSFYLFPQWEPTGSSIYCYRRVDDVEDYIRIDLETGRQEVVREGWSAHKQIYVKVSPDGKQLLYLLFEDPRKVPQLTVEDFETGETRAFPVPLFDPRWSPDGKRVVGFNFMGMVSVVDVATGKAQVIDSGYGQEWDADGEHVYFVVQVGEEYALRRSTPDGKTKEDVAHLGPIETFNVLIDVAPSGELAWVEFEAGRSELWVLEYE